MAGLSKEEIIMTSNDNAITLTTHRVLHKTSKLNREILLKDIVSQEVVKKRHRYYKILSLFFGILTIVLFLLYLSKSTPFDRTGETETAAIFVISIIFTFISLFLLLITNEKFLNITGRFNEIEFSLKDLNESSLNKFLNRLTVESDNRKRED